MNNPRSMAYEIWVIMNEFKYTFNEIKELTDDQMSFLLAGLNKKKTDELEAMKSK